MRLKKKKKQHKDIRNINGIKPETKEISKAEYYEQISATIFENDHIKNDLRRNGNTEYISIIKKGS